MVHGRDYPAYVHLINDNKEQINLQTDNEYTHAMSTCDNRILDLYKGNSFWYVNTFNIPPNRRRRILWTAPPKEWRCVISIFADSLYPCEMIVYTQPEVVSAGQPAIDPAPINRNFRPEKYRSPQYKITLNPTVNNRGTVSIRERIDWQFVAPMNFIDRSVVASPDGVALMRFRNLDTVNTNPVNLFATWQEHELDGIS